MRYHKKYGKKRSYKKGTRSKYGVRGRMKGKKLRRYGVSRGGIRL